MQGVSEYIPRGIEGVFNSWWLWEDVEKVVWVGDEDKQREISVRTVEELYDFLTEQMEG